MENKKDQRNAIKCYMYGNNSMYSRIMGKIKNNW